MKDNFSTQANAYSKFRPDYPDEVFQYLYSHLKKFDNAWDCGTGNGQVAVKLSEKFDSVIATDLSEKQITNAIHRPNIIYRVESAEQATFPPDHFDLITVAQAIHWFDFDVFYAIVNEVINPNGLFAVIGYGLLKVDDAIDEIIGYLYSKILGSYWDSERRSIDENYKTIPFPFDELSVPTFVQTYHWTIEQVIGFLNTWSAVQHYQRENGDNPVEKITNQLQSAWGVANTKSVHFPILLRVGKKERLIRHHRE
ncbi:MAG: class I SAM-dependent methyltransferase [Candidatus Marinimicrobia bacterium]|nr:class I SAM-dependent methyltransferase [Candidatus Neomarinimicrobiota bacterium]